MWRDDSGFGALNQKMNRLTIIFIIATLVTTNVFAQVIKKCDIDILGQINAGKENLDQKDIKKFLLTFDKSCDTNIEYSEFSNELLFMVLDQYTQTLVAVMQKEKKNLETEYILYEIGSPINDSFDLKNVIAKVENVKVVGKLKGQIIEKLKEALAKY
jgi:hypothetical protein